MFKKFGDGLVFGAGFSISFVVISYLGAYLLSSFFLETQLEEGLSEFKTQVRAAESSGMFDDDDAQISAMSSGSDSLEDSIARARGEERALFWELDVTQKIDRASVIALTELKKAPDGEITEVIKEIVKKDDGVVFHYAIGDELLHSRLPTREGVEYGDGNVVFFTGSPAEKRFSMTYRSDRIASLGDMPMTAFKRLCAHADR